MRAKDLNLTDREAEPEADFRPMLVGVADTCRILGIGKSKLYELCAGGSLHKVRFGGRALITMQSIDALVDELVRVGRL